MFNMQISDSVKKRKGSMDSCQNISRRLQDAEDDTNPLFISAVRIFLDYVRERHNLSCPEKCTLDQLIGYLSEFQEVAKTKKGERYSPSTIRVIRYSLNRVIALGKNQLEMRPYPTQSNGARKRQREQEFPEVPVRNDGQMYGKSSSLTMPVPGYFSSTGTTFGNFGMDCLDSQISSGAVKTELWSPMSSLQHGVTAFRGYLLDQQLDPKFENYAPATIKQQLENFLHMVKANLGKVYTSNSVQTMRSAIIQHLKQHGVDLDREDVYSPYADIFHSSLLSSRKKLCGTAKIGTVKSSQECESTEWLGIPVEQIKELYKSGALSTANALTLQQKIWFELTIFFRGVPCCPDQMFWNKNTFKISSGDRGMKYAELNPDMYNRFGCATAGRSSGGGKIMVQRMGSPYCPVFSLELYLQCLDPDCDLLFTKPEEICPKSSSVPFRYSKEPQSAYYHSSMMAKIAEAAKLPFHFTNLSVSETDHIAWMRGLTALEIELQCQTNCPPESPLSPVRHSVIQSAPRSQKTFSVSSPDSTTLIERPRRVSSPEECPPSAASSSSSEEIGAGKVTDNTPGHVGTNGIIWKKKFAMTYNSERKDLEEKNSLITTPLARQCSEWCSATGKDPNLSSYTLPQLDETLADFLVCLSNKIDGKSFEPTISALMQPNADFDVKRFPKVTTFLHQAHLSKNNHSAKPLTKKELETLYSCGVFDVDQPESLQNKVLFELIISCEQFFFFPLKLKFWLKRFFQVARKADGRKRVTASGYAVSGTKGYPEMYERPGDPACPVKSYELYLTKLSDNSIHLFPECLKIKDRDQKCWYGTQVDDLSDINERLEVIVRKANLARGLTLGDVGATPISDWLAVFKKSTTSLEESARCSPSAIKRVLAVYRAETASEESDASLDYSPKMRIVESPDSEARANSDIMQSEGPVVVVRPQIVIVNRGNSPLNRDDLRNRINEALSKAMNDPEWEQVISSAVKAAEGKESSRSYTPDSMSSFVDHDGKSCPNSNVSSSNQQCDYSLKLSPRAEKELYDDVNPGSTVDVVLENGSHVDKESPTVGAKETPVPPATDDAHGSLRRKAFKPTRH